MVSSTPTFIAFAATFLLSLSSVSANFTNTGYTQTFAPCLVEFAKDQFNVTLPVDEVTTSVSRFDFKHVKNLIKAANVSDEDLTEFANGFGECLQQFAERENLEYIIGNLVIGIDCACLEIRNLTQNDNIPCDEISATGTILDAETAEKGIEDLYKDAGFDILLPENEGTFNRSLEICMEKMQVL